jgi:hypothetical protein
VFHSNEVEADDWSTILNELIIKTPTDFTFNNIWMTSDVGEVLECGFVKITGEEP